MTIKWNNTCGVYRKMFKIIHTHIINAENYM